MSVLTIGVEITATGEANVHWTEEESHGSGDDQTSETIHYRSSETYLVNKFTVQMAGIILTAWSTNLFTACHSPMAKEYN